MCCFVFELKYIVDYCDSAYYVALSAIVFPIRSLHIYLCIGGGGGGCGWIRKDTFGQRLGHYEITRQGEGVSEDQIPDDMEKPEYPADTTEMKKFEIQI